VVERAKKCLDFAATIHLFHFLGCLVYAGFPTAWLWWLLMLFSLLCMTSTSPPSSPHPTYARARVDGFSFRLPYFFFIYFFSTS
jgi:hypothetical protein